jgi:hypothetical protein
MKAIERVKYIYICIVTDQHWGGRSKVWLWDALNQRFLGLAEGVFELMRRAGYGDGEKLVPFHCLFKNDDQVQGQHFDAYKQPHPEELPYYIYERELRRKHQELVKEEDPIKRKKLSDQILWFVLHQRRIQGVDSTGEQMEMVLHEHLEPNIDIISGLIRRVHDRKIIIQGEQEILGLPNSRRDLGVVNDGTGNHFLKTVDGHLTEGVIYANYTRHLLLTRDTWRDKGDFLMRYVRAPLTGISTVGYGIIQAPGGYPWGLEFRNTPAAKGTDWGDPIRIWVRTDLQRGNPSRILEGRVTLKVCGDKHFFSYCRTNYAIYVMGPASTETDSYGELGFPPNNSGVLFVGLPAEGPKAGPILIRPLFYRQIKDYLEGKPRPFDWEAFLPNAL